MRHYCATPLLIRLLVLLAWVWPLLAGAQVLRLDGEEPMQATAGHLQRLDDPSRGWSAAQAAEAPGWQALPGHLNAGFTTSAVWLRLPLEVAQPGDWVLVLSNALLDDVQVYARRQEGGWRLLGRSGEDVPRRAWPVDYRSPAIVFDADTAGAHELLVRLESKNAIALRLDVWQRLDFDNHTRRQALVFGLYFGVYLLLICVHGVFWWATRAALSGLFLAYVSSCVLNAVLWLGLLQQLTGMPVAWSDRLLALGLCSAVAVGVQLACRQLALARRYPHAVPVLVRSVWLFCIACALAALLLRYAWGIVPLQMVFMALMLGFLGLALWLWLRRGHRPAGFFLVAFGIFDACVLVAFLRNLGVVPLLAVVSEQLVANAAALGTLAHMLLLSVWIIGGHELRRQARERQQVQLEAELAQRQRRESELSEALALERRVHQEQREFVAMVSHEFRTPLAIITTSAQQLGRNLDAPPEKQLARSRHIREAAQRLLALLDDYLSDDRLRASLSEPQLVDCDLRALAAELCEGFAPGRVACDFGAGADRLMSDAGLLKIALRNLLANADRHAPAGAVVQLRTARAGAGLHIEIANPAPRIAPEDQTQLFDKYYRGQNARHQPGAGLGLYLVRRIAERLGGSVALAAAGGDEPVCLRLVLPIR
ncbi:sensor histidine kinase [Comamonas humi]